MMSFSSLSRNRQQVHTQNHRPAAACVAVSRRSNAGPARPAQPLAYSLPTAKGHTCSSIGLQPKRLSTQVHAFSGSGIYWSDAFGWPGNPAADASHLPPQYAHASISEATLRQAVRCLQVDMKCPLERQRTQLLQDFILELQAVVKGRRDLPWVIDRTRMTGSSSRRTATAYSSDRDVVLFLLPRSPCPAPEGTPEWHQYWIQMVEESGEPLREAISLACWRLQQRGGLVASVGIKTSFGEYWYNWSRITIGSPEQQDKPYVEVDFLSAPHLVADLRNHVPLPRHRLVTSLRQAQAKRIWALCQRLHQKVTPPERISRFGPGTCESLTAYIAQTPGEVNEAAVWLKSIFYTQLKCRGYVEKIYGLSFLLELLCAYAYGELRSLRQFGTKSDRVVYVVDILERALQLLSSVHALDVRFESETQVQRLLPSYAARLQQPVVLDPSNPFANVAEGLLDVHGALTVVEEIARQTKAKVQRRVTLGALLQH